MENGAQSSIGAKDIVTQGWPQIMPMESKQVLCDTCFNNFITFLLLLFYLY